MQLPKVIAVLVEAAADLEDQRGELPPHLDLEVSDALAAGTRDNWKLAS